MSNNVAKKQNQGLTVAGYYRVNGGKWHKNLVVNNDDNGINRILKALYDDTPALEITHLGIGTGTTAPTQADTNLETLTIKKIPQTKSIDGNKINYKFYFSDVDLPDDTYTEIGLYQGTNLFSRTLLAPTYVKGTGQNLTIDYYVQIT